LRCRFESGHEHKFFKKMEKEYKYTLIIQGPPEYVKNGILIQQLIITEEDLEEFPEMTKEEAIKVLLNDEKDEWTQRWCTCTVLNEEEALITKKFLLGKE
jgi:hypothetical protein